MAVHSTQLAANGNLVHSQVTLYTVPTGKRTIVKSAIVRNQAAAAQVVTLYVFSGGSEVASLNYHLAAAGSAGDTISDLTWFVINAGQQLRAIAGSSFAEIIVSGAELDL